MELFPRRSVDEVYAKYDFHPDIIDIYVEGEFDFDFLNLFIEESGLFNISVFSIDDIDIGRDLVERFDLSSGSNKNRVLALASALDIRYGKRATNVACLVDADCDRILHTNRRIHHLLETDFACCEGYLASKKTIERFMKFVCCLTDNDVNNFLKVAKKILPSQFSLRAVVQILNLKCPINNFSSGLKNKRLIDTFDDVKYVDAFIVSNSLKSQSDEIKKAFSEIKSVCSTDFRNCMQGHDFIDLLFNFVWERGALKLHDKNETQSKYGGRLLAANCRVDDLSNEHLFSKLRIAASGGENLCS